MIILLVIAMSYRVTGERAHEALGFALLALFIVHNVVNRDWYKTLFKGRYNYARLGGGLINILLILCVIATAVTGMLASPTFFPHADGQAARQVHSMTAHWMLILVGAHLGLHWGVIMASMLRALKVNDRHLAIKTLLRLLALIIVIGGVQASFAKDVGAKLVMYFSFSFWDGREAALRFMLDYLLVMALYACLTYYMFKFLKILHKAAKGQGLAQP